ncbi:hypothetical protein C8R43DRAFT_1050373 [Mycena crocata]|nr:hypothetical protein C8R43DRAFT_1050373 [Mycena crocata]
MPEDDSIQYLGTRPAVRPIPSHPFLSSSQRPVTGVALNIEKSATEPNYGLTFRKSEEPVVHIGRRPGSDSDKRKNEPGKAFFTCPVVSRHHAKLVFSDSGHCYLTDLRSHHGTHIRKRDEALSKPLNPETPTLLADGDVVTFGKSVGSDKGLVRPVVARVELLYGSQPPLKPLVVPGSAEGHLHKSLRPPSGRYGVYVPASSEASSSSDELASHDSDIEEVSGPSPLAVRLPWHDNSSGSASSSPVQGVQKPGHSECLAPPRQFLPYPLITDEYRAFSPPHEMSPFDRNPFYNVGFDAYSNDIFEDDDNSDISNYSRSTSPMDLSSSPEPSDPPAYVNKESLMAIGEPVIIGAWPRSRSSSPSVFSTSFPPIRVVAPVEECVAATPAADKADSPEAVDVQAIVSVEAEAVVGNKDESEEPVESSETVQLKASLATIKTEVAKLHVHRRKYKQRFNDNIHVMGEKFSDLEDRTTEAHDLYNMLSERLEESVDLCHQAQAQLDVLQSRMDTEPEVTPAVETTTPYVDEAKGNAKILEDLVAEMTALRDTTRKEIASELESIREAKDALKSLTQDLRNETTSLKRKRSAEDHELDATPKEVAIAEGIVLPPPRKRVRQVVKVLAQTATAVTIGAAVTWSALAFS